MPANERILSQEDLDLPLNEFGVAAGGSFLRLEMLISDLRSTLDRAKWKAETLRRQVEDDSELEALIEEGREYRQERRWTMGEVLDLAAIGDPKGIALLAPGIKILMESATMMYETNATAFPPLVWSSVVITALARWELALRAYGEYLSIQLNCPGLSPQAGLFKHFKSFCKRSAKLRFDFGESAEWCEMQKHQAVRNITVHWGGVLAGPDAATVEDFLQRGRSGLERHGNAIVCTDRYAECVVETAKGFLTSFDEVAREQFPHLWHHDTQTRRPA